jgi:hypothetical protein
MHYARATPDKSAGTKYNKLRNILSTVSAINQSIKQEDIH